MTTPLGSDGRPLVTTAMAAYLRGWSPSTFRKWAVRKEITPVTYRATGNRGRGEALWDLADIADAVLRKRAA